MAGTLSIIGLALAAGACSSGPGTPSDPVLAKGQEIYNQRCQACHGPSGEGVSAPAFYGIANRLTLEKHEQTILEGRAGTRMPGFKDSLTADEVEAVARYEREVLGVKD